MHTITAHWYRTRWKAAQYLMHNIRVPYTDLLALRISCRTEHHLPGHLRGSQTPVPTTDGAFDRALEGIKWPFVTMRLHE